MEGIPLDYTSNEDLISKILIEPDDPNIPVIYNVKLRNGNLIEHINIDALSDDYILGKFTGTYGMTICIARNDIVWIARYN